MGRIERKHLDAPDEVRELPLLTLNLVRIGPLTIGLGRVEPGFRWSTHLRKETDEPLCQIHHVQFLLSGRFAVEMDDGEYVEFEPNEVFDVPPGHDAWVIGDEPAVLLDFLGNIEQLGWPASRDRIVTTLLMTDIVDSTAIASRLGDGTWKQRLGEHNRLVRNRLERYLGQEVNTTGDGFLAMFASARGAIRCAASVDDGIDMSEEWVTLARWPAARWAPTIATNALSSPCTGRARCLRSRCGSSRRGWAHRYRSRRCRGHLPAG
jgi:mannose-6-phosphate isomerase-like protein (cupin superfamily)